MCKEYIHIILWIFYMNGARKHIHKYIDTPYLHTAKRACMRNNQTNNITWRMFASNTHIHPHMGLTSCRVSSIQNACGGGARTHQHILSMHYIYICVCVYIMLYTATKIYMCLNGSRKRKKGTRQWWRRISSRLLFIMTILMSFYLFYWHYKDKQVDMLHKYSIHLLK